MNETSYPSDSWSHTVQNNNSSNLRSSMTEENLSPSNLLQTQFTEFQRQLNRLDQENAALRQEIILLKTNKEAEASTKLKENIAKNASRQLAIQKMLATQTDKGLELRKDINELLLRSQDIQNTINSKVAELKEELKQENKKRVELDGIVKKINQRLDEHEIRIVTNQSMAANLSAPSSSSTSGSSGIGSGSGSGDANKKQILQTVERQLGMYDLQIAAQDLRFQLLEQTSYSGTLVWKITDYKRRKKEATSGRSLSLYSQPFYTSRFGYKMCTRVYLNGDGMGKNTHLSLFFVVMRGEYDAMLQWPFAQKVTLMLLDQGPSRTHLSDTFRPDPTSSSFKKPTSDMNIASGCPLFVAHNVIENQNAYYIKDDTIFVKVRVDTSDIEGP